MTVSSSFAKRVGKTLLTSTFCTKGKRMHVLLQQKNMKRLAVLILVLTWAYSLIAAPPAAPGDSVGIKTVGEQNFILYKVSPGETVYSVCRRYNVPFASVVAANTDVNMDQVKAGQVILVPRGNTASAASTTAAPQASETPKATTPKATTTTSTAPVTSSKPAISKESGHTVQDGETLYSISRAYGIDFSDLLAANPELTDYTIHSGQIIRLPGSTLASVTTAAVEPIPATPSTTTHTTNTAHSEEAASGEGVSQGNNMLLTNGRIDKNKSFAQVYAEYTGNDFIAHAEKGVATWIDGSSEFGKNGERFYALHNNAPIGSVIKVRNLMNNRIIYAKVIGTLSESEVQEKVTVKLSAGAAEKLNVLDNRFVAEVNYFTVEDTTLR
jgi:LysM repeat protein